MSMSIYEIVEEFLRSNGYDGLCSDGCACDLRDLMHCGCLSECRAGFYLPQDCWDDEEKDKAAFVIVEGDKLRPRDRRPRHEA
jgi:hypothetical protein